MRRSRQNPSRWVRAIPPEAVIPTMTNEGWAADKKSGAAIATRRKSREGSGVRRPVTLPATNSADITVFKQNSDQGVGFMALAKLAHDKARAHGLGVEI
jgi:hypothetical protein